MFLPVKIILNKCLGYPLYKQSHNENLFSVDDNKSLTSLSKNRHIQIYQRVVVVALDFQSFQYFSHLPFPMPMSPEKKNLCSKVMVLYETSSFAMVLIDCSNRQVLEP